MADIEEWIKETVRDLAANLGALEWHESLVGEAEQIIARHAPGSKPAPAGTEKRTPKQRFASAPPLPEPGKYPIDRPCSACSAGDTEMKHHDHEPPFRKGYGPSVSASSISARDSLLKEYEASGETGSLSFCGWLVKQVMERRASAIPQTKAEVPASRPSERDREAFEEYVLRWLPSYGLARKGNGYADADTDNVWLGWLAGRNPVSSSRQDSAKAQAWISVEERLPPDEGPWLVFHWPEVLRKRPDADRELDADQWVAYFVSDQPNKKPFWAAEIMTQHEHLPLKDVTHWRPLPDPPVSSPQPESEEKK